MKKVEKLKTGMEVWIKFRVEEYGDVDFPFYLSSFGTFTEDCRNFKGKPPFEMFTIDENEIPELKGVLMEVSDDKVTWIENDVYCKTPDGYLTSEGYHYEYARPIQKTFDLTNVPEHLLTEELKQYLK